MNTQLQIKNVGRMWRVYASTTVLAFASTYALAEARADELKATNAAQRVQQWRAAR